MIVAMLSKSAIPIVLGLAVAVTVNPAVARERRPPHEKKVAPSDRPALDPKAIDILKEMSTKLAGAHSMRFTAVTTYEGPSRLGPPLAYTTLSQVTLQRPDKLAVISPGDGPATEFYYDGKTVTALAPAENLVAIADAPPTIDAMLKAAYDMAAIYFPYTDLIVADPYGDVADSLGRAFYIGQSHVVGGVTTDMVAIAGNGVLVQLWIGVDDRLPRMARAMYADDPAHLRHEVAFSDWHLDGQVAADAFTSSRAAAATRIDFARPDPVRRPGAPSGSTRKAPSPKN